MKLRLLIFISLITLIAFSSCRKSKLNKLTGSWELLPQTAAEQNNTVIWTFDAENKLLRTINDSLVDSADYVLKSEFTKYYVEITNLDKYTDANYYIEKMNKKILILQCQSPYLRKEFVRHDE